LDSSEEEGGEMGEGGGEKIGGSGEVEVLDEEGCSLGCRGEGVGGGCGSRRGGRVEVGSDDGRRGDGCWSGRRRRSFLEHSSGSLLEVEDGVSKSFVGESFES